MLIMQPWMIATANSVVWNFKWDFKIILAPFGLNVLHEGRKRSKNYIFPQTSKGRKFYQIRPQGRNILLILFQKKLHNEVKSFLMEHSCFLSLVPLCRASRASKRSINLESKNLPRKNEQKKNSTWGPEIDLSLLCNDFFDYHKVRAVTCQLVAHFWFFRLFMKGKFDAYVSGTFGQKSSKLNSRPVYCLRLYSTDRQYCGWIFWFFFFLFFCWTWTL